MKYRITPLPGDLAIFRDEQDECFVDLFGKEPTDKAIRISGDTEISLEIDDTLLLVDSNKAISLKLNLRQAMFLAGEFSLTFDTPDESYVVDVQ